MHSYEAVNKFKNFLHKHLEDPLNRKGNWIYADDVRKDLDKSPFPKINLRKVDQSSESEIRQIGSTTRTVTFPVILEVIAGAGQLYGVGQERLSSEELISKIGDWVERSLRDNQNELCDEGFDSVLVEQESYQMKENKNPRFEMTINLKFPSP